MPTLIATRVARRWLLAEESAEEDFGEKEFIDEVGDKTVSNPDEPEHKVKVKSLRHDQDHPRSKQLLKKMFQDWKKSKDKGGEDEDGEDEGRDKPLDIQHDDHVPDKATSKFLSSAKGAPRKVYDAIKGKAEITAGMLADAMVSTTQALGRGLHGELTDMDHAAIAKVDDWLRNIADTVAGRKDPKGKSRFRDQSYAGHGGDAE